MMNSYDLSRRFFDWSFENPEKVTPTHVAMYFFIIEQCNRLGWKEKFGLPTTMVKEAIGIRNFRTYVNTLNDLVEWGFVVMIERSKNQHSCNIVAIVKNATATTKAPAKALDKALQKHSQKHYQSTDSIDKQETIKQETINTDIDKIYALYPSRCPTKNTSTGKTIKNKDKIKLLLEKYTSDELVKKINDYVNECKMSRTFIKNFGTFLNNIPDDIVETSQPPYSMPTKDEPYRTKARINPDGSIQFI